MEQERSFRSSYSAPPSYLQGYPPLGYGYLPPMYPGPYPQRITHTSTPLQDSLPTPSHSSSGDSSPRSNSGDEQPPFFRPVDFDSYARSFSYPPTPTDSESDCTSPSHLGGISVLLLDKELWDPFSAVGNEMIVTKPGRRLFPAVLVTIRGLNPNTEYEVSLKITSADHYRYKYLSSRWVPVGDSELIQNEKRQVFQHPGSPNTGEHWMKKPVSFKALKITHNTNSKQGNVLLHTMHKYIMDVVIQPVGTVECPPPIVIRLQETAFIAVTSYQNTTLTRLKIENNPFAKGFREKENASILPLWQMPHYCMPPLLMPPYSPAIQPSHNQDSSPDLAPERPVHFHCNHPYTMQPYPGYPPYPWPWYHGHHSTFADVDCSDINKGED